MSHLRIQTDSRGTLKVYIFTACVYLYIVQFVPQICFSIISVSLLGIQGRLSLDLLGIANKPSSCSVPQR
jgi:hypothetical protein